MNAFDFDKTIYKNDSTVDFVLYSIRRHPSLLRHLPAVAAAYIRYRMHKISLTETKAVLFRAFRDIPDFEDTVRAFWDTHAHNVKQWYLDVRKEDDVVVSASPEFLIFPICDRLGIRNRIASRVDPKTFLYDGLNCDRQEKVRRFREMYPDTVPVNFFSDSKADIPMADLSEQAYLIRGNSVLPWPWERNRNGA